MLGFRSLKSRIMLLFVGLALLPFLVASFVLQRRADRVLEGIVVQNATAVGAGVGKALDALVARSLNEAVAFASAERLGSTNSPSEGVRSIRVIDDAGFTVQAWRAADPSFQGTVCAEPGSLPFVVQRSGLIAGFPEWTVEVAVDPHGVLSQQDTPLFGGGEVIVVAGEAVATRSERCPTTLASPLAQADDGSSGPEVWLTAEQWAVQVRPDNALFGPTLFGLNAMLGVIGLSVAALATLLFALSVGGVTRSLRQLTEAADRIGEGDFDIWLPPPGDDEAGRLSAALSTMMTRVHQTMERMKRVGQMAAVGEVASYMTHEIRNPLSSLKLNLQSIERANDGKSLTDSSARSLDICLREIDRLEAVASGVLRLSRLESEGSLDLSWAHAVIRYAAELLKPEFDRRDVVVQFDLAAKDDTIRCDAQRLEAVFINLLLNAAEAMPTGGSIWVSTSDAELERGPALAIRVSDSGVGIPPEMRSRIFEPFFTTREGGSGVGLSVAAQTIHDHGGTINIGPRTSVLEGAVFDIVLPTPAAHDDAGREPDTYEWPFVGKRTSPARKTGWRKSGSPQGEAQ